MDTEDAQDSPNQQAARWYARLRAADCTPSERAQFESWRTRDPRNAAAYAAAERISDAVASLATTDPRLKVMVDEAAGAGAGAPDETPDDERGNKAKSLTITAG